MLRKILILAVSICAATLFVLPPDALAWGCGSWSRSGSASYTGRYGNTYSRSWNSSGSGYHYGGWGGYHGGYYGHREYRAHDVRWNGHDGHGDHH